MNESDKLFLIVLFIGASYLIVIVALVKAWRYYKLRRSQRLAELEEQRRKELAESQRRSREYEIVAKQKEEQAANWKSWKRASDQEYLHRQKSAHQKEINEWDWKD
jgi:hypothetical protein